MLEQLREKLTPSFFHESVSEKEVVDVTVEPLEQNSGYANDLFQVKTTDAAGSSRTRVVKVAPDEKVDRSIQLGLPREGLFFSTFAKEVAGLRSFLPEVSYAEGGMSTGRKMILMEKLEGVQAGLLFQRHHPSTLSSTDEELAAARAKCGGITELELVTQAFKIAAQVHSAFWMDEKLLDKEWLRSSEVVKPRPVSSVEGEAESKTWRGSMDWAADCWKTIQTDILSKEEPSVKIPSRLVKCVETMMANVDYKNYCAKFCDPSEPGFYPWSLVHGDFYAGNFIYCTDRADSNIKLVDFEMIGCGSGAQDLGQFLWSNATPSFRREHEKRLVEEVYYPELIKNLPEGAYVPSVEQVFEEYKLGGLGRAVWFLCLLVTMMPAEMGQFFVDQTVAWMDDHFPEGSDLTGVFPRF